MKLPNLTDMWAATLSWQPDEQQQALFQRLYELILEGNQQFNLTRITEPEEFWEKHVWDSLRGICYPSLAVGSQNSIDIGTGAGFPGIPVAIAHPHWTMTLLDSTRKKMAFLDTLLATLDMHHVKTLTDRAEQVGQSPHHRGRYDLALIRAVASASVCAEYALPLLNLRGLAILYRGQWTPEEAETLPAVVRQLGGDIEAIEQFTTPLTQSLRHCIYIRKTAPTPTQFPRPTGIPTQKPMALQ